MCGHLIINDDRVSLTIAEVVQTVCSIVVGLLRLYYAFHEILFNIFSAEKVKHSSQIAEFDTELDEIFYVCFLTCCINPYFFALEVKQH